MTDRAWTIREALAWTIGYFERASIEKPRLSAEWLLSAATGLSRVELYAYHDRPLTPEERTALRASIERRAKGEPLQYVTGEMPFRHLVLRVRPGVFIPRPETEVLVDVALETLGQRGVGGTVANTPQAGEVHSDAKRPTHRGPPPRTVSEGPADAEPGSPVVVDLCTGSGAVAVSLAHEAPSAVLYATDLNPAAVELASENAESSGVADRVTALHGDLFAPLPADLRGRVALVVANPPYIPSADLPDLPAEVLGYEPRLALDGGADGLDVARRVMTEARVWLMPGGALAMELDEGRVAQAVEEARAAGLVDMRVVRDLAGRDRVLVGFAAHG